VACKWEKLLFGIFLSAVMNLCGFEIENTSLDVGAGIDSGMFFCIDC